MATTQSGNGDPTMMWVYGKANPGWYVAAWIWREHYAEHWREMGYNVQRSVEKPVE